MLVRGPEIRAARARDPQEFAAVLLVRRLGVETRVAQAKVLRVAAGYLLTSYRQVVARAAPV